MNYVLNNVVMSFPDVWLNPRAQTLTSYAILGMSVEYAECMNLTVQELIQGLRKHFELLPAWITEVSPSDVDGKSGGKVHKDVTGPSHSSVNALSTRRMET